jgi:hypothetical protein
MTAGADEPGRMLGAAGFSPPEAGWRQRRAQTREARRLEADTRAILGQQRRRERQLLRDEQRQCRYLPATGERGPSALRCWRPLKVPPHRATSEVLGGAYPFLADAGLGSEGMMIGHDSWSGAAFVFDPWVLYRQGILTNPNVVLAGVIGRGKSALAKSLATRSIAFGRKVYVPGDPKGEWTAVAEAVGGQTISLGAGSPNRLNPLDARPSPTTSTGSLRWQAETQRRRRSLLGSLTESVLARPLTPTEHTAVDAALDAAVAASAEPTLPSVVDALLDPPAGHRGSDTCQLRDDGRQAGHALARLVRGDLAGLFDGPSTVRFDPALPMVSLDLSGISGSDTLIGLVMTCASAWIEGALADPAGGNRWVIYDEAWRLLRQPSLLARMQAQWKLSRAFGIANLMVIHRLSDLDAVGEDNSQARNLALGLLADCSTKIIYTQEHAEASRTATALGLSSTETAQLPELERGEGLWRVGQRSFMVRHALTPGELELFDTNSRMLVDPRHHDGAPSDGAPKGGGIEGPGQPRAGDLSAERNRPSPSREPQFSQPPTSSPSTTWPTTTQATPIPSATVSDPGLYGALAARHMARWQPAAYASILPDERDRWFRDLNDRVAQAIREREEQLILASDLASRDLLERQGQIQMAHLMAEEQVLAEMVLLPPEREAVASEGEPPTDPGGAYLNPGWRSPSLELDDQEWEENLQL